MLDKIAQQTVGKKKTLTFRINRFFIIVLCLVLILFYSKYLFTVSASVVSKEPVQAFVVSSKTKIDSRSKAGDFNVYAVQFVTTDHKEFSQTFEDSLLRGHVPVKGELFWFTRINWDNGNTGYLVSKDKILERFMNGRQFIPSSSTR